MMRIVYIMLLNVTIIFLIFAGNAVRADVFTYHPLSTLRLGGTFDPYDLTRPRPDCLSDSEEISADGQNGSPVTPDLKFFIRQVTDRRELNSILSQSISVSGHYSFFSGDGSFAQQDEIHSVSDSLSWVLSLTARYGKYRLKKVTLGDETRALANKDLLQLINRCGSSVVLQVTRGISAAVVVTIQGNQRTERETSQAKASAKAAGDMWSASASAGDDKSLEQALTSGQATIQLQISGGAGMPGLSGLITSLKAASSINDIKVVLERYVVGMGPASAVPLEYETTSISDLVPELALPDFATYQELIGEYFLALQENKYFNHKVLTFLSQSADFDPSMPEIAKAVAQLTKIRANFGEIAKSAKACRRAFEDLLQELLEAQQPAVVGRVRSRQTLIRAFRLFNDGATDLVSASRAQYELPDIRNANQTVVKLTSTRDADLRSIFGPPHEPDLLNSAADCKFDPAWLDFAAFPQLPAYPFRYTTFSDPLGQAPNNFLYFNVATNPRVESVRLIGGSETAPATLQIVPQNPAGDWIGMIDLADPQSVRPVSAVVKMKSSMEYTISLVR
jgi:hypothetical protein